MSGPGYPAAPSPRATPVVILCGGRGTRLREHTELRPKPMIEIGGRPLLVHLMELYAHSGFRDFILCLGYKAELIKRYFLDFAALQADFTVDLSAPGQLRFHHAAPVDWRVTCVDTGLDAMTGARLRRVERYLTGDDFLLTYGDGLADLDPARVLAFHREHGRACTVTGVRPPSRFGELETAGARVLQFSEKPATQHGWINGGFFACSRQLLRYVSDDDDCVLEGEPLARCARDGQMTVYRHDGFWQCMDTARDLERLEALWARGEAPWRRTR